MNTSLLFFYNWCNVMNNKHLAFRILIFILIVFSSPLYSQENDDNGILGFSYFSEDLENLRLFDERGYLQRDLETIKTLKAGWIIQTGKKNLTLESDKLGKLIISPGTIIFIDSITEQNLSVFVLQGKLRIISE